MDLDRAFVSLASLSALLLTSALASQEERQTEQQVGRCIEQLASGDVEIRDAASRRLIASGRLAVPGLAEFVAAGKQAPDEDSPLRSLFGARGGRYSLAQPEGRLLGRAGPDVTPPTSRADLRRLAPMPAPSNSRYLAVWILGQIGEEAAGAAKVLIDCLAAKTKYGDRFPALHEYAAHSLRCIGKTAVPALRDYLATEHETFSQDAAETLVLMDDGAEPVLLAHLARPTTIAGRAVCRCIALWLPEPSAALRRSLITNLGHSDETVSRSAAAAIARYGEACMTEVIAALESGRRPLRRRALGMLAILAPHVGKRGSEIDELLLPIATEEEGLEQRWATYGLGRLRLSEAHAKQAAVAIEPQLKLSFGLNLLAIDAAGTLGESGASLVPTLMHIAEHRTGSESTKALRAIEALGPHAKEAVPLCKRLALLGDRDKAKAAISIRFIGTHGAEHLPFLLELLDDWQGLQHATPIAHALQAIGTPAIQPLLDRLSAKDDQIRRSSLIALARFQVTPTQFREPLISKAGEESKETRQWAVRALAKLKDVGQDEAVMALILTQLSSELRSDDRAIVRSALWFIRELKHLASPVEKKVVPHMASAERLIRRSAQLALEAMGTESPALVAALLANLKNSPKIYPAYLISSLADLGPKASAALPTLRERYEALRSSPKTGGKRGEWLRGSRLDGYRDAIRRIEARGR